MHEQVIATTTLLDIAWQDGRYSYAAPAREFCPISHVDEHDFWPEDLVEDKPDDLDLQATPAHRCGAEHDIQRLPYLVHPLHSFKVPSHSA